MDLRPHISVLGFAGRRDRRLHLHLHGLMLKDPPRCIGGNWTKVSAYFATSCCTKVKRQNSCMKKSGKNINDPPAPVGMPMRSKGSTRRLVIIGTSSLTVPPNQPVG